MTSIFSEFFVFNFHQINFSIKFFFTFFASDNFFLFYFKKENIVKKMYLWYRVIVVGILLANLLHVPTSFFLINSFAAMKIVLMKNCVYILYIQKFGKFMIHFVTFYDYFPVFLLKKCDVKKVEVFFLINS